MSVQSFPIPSFVSRIFMIITSDSHIKGWQLRTSNFLKHNYWKNNNMQASLVFIGFTGVMLVYRGSVMIAFQFLGTRDMNWLKKRCNNIPYLWTKMKMKNEFCKEKLPAPNFGNIWNNHIVSKLKNFGHFFISNSYVSFPWAVENKN